MVSTARIFFAGVGTTFGILAIGFGGGVLMANSTLHDEVAQKRIVSEPPPGVRVIQPPSSQPSLITAAAPVEAPAPETTPEQQAPPQVSNRIQTQEKDKQAERVEQRKMEAAELERRKRSAERRARRDAARAKQLQEQQQEGQPQQSGGVLAFGVDGPPKMFGN